MHKTHWLSVDLSGPRGTIALHAAEGTRLLEEAVTSDQGHHLETFLPALEALLGRHGVALEDLGRLLTPSGPGSFTGLRLGLASLKALAFGLKCPLSTVSASEARALAWARETGRTEPPWVLTHATSEKVVVGNPLEERVLTWSELAGLKGLCLLDDRIPPEKLPAGLEGVWFPLSARHLAEAYPTAGSRRDGVDGATLINLSPDYFGTSFKPVR